MGIWKEKVATIECRFSWGWVGDGRVLKRKEKARNSPERKHGKWKEERSEFAFTELSVRWWRLGPGLIPAQSGLSRMEQACLDTGTQDEANLSLTE